MEVFGSRLTGLWTADSDADLTVCGGMFDRPDFDPAVWAASHAAQAPPPLAFVAIIQLFCDKYNLLPNATNFLVQRILQSDHFLGASRGRPDCKVFTLTFITLGGGAFQSNSTHNMSRYV